MKGVFNMADFISWETEETKKEEEEVAHGIAHLLQHVSKCESEEISWRQIQKLSLFIDEINLFDFLLDIDTKSKAGESGLTEDEAKEAFRIFSCLLCGDTNYGVETDCGRVADLYDDAGLDVQAVDDYWIIS